MKNEKIDMSRESDTFHVSQDGVYTITGTKSPKKECILLQVPIQDME